MREYSHVLMQVEIIVDHVAGLTLAIILINIGSVLKVPRITSVVIGSLG